MFKSIFRKLYYHVFIIFGFISCSSDNDQLLYANNTDSSRYKAQTIIENYIQAIGGRERLEQIRSIWKRSQVNLLLVYPDAWNYDTYLSDSKYLYQNLQAVHFLGKKIAATLNKDTIQHTYVFFKREKKENPI